MFDFSHFNDVLLKLLPEYMEISGAHAILQGFCLEVALSPHFLYFLFEGQHSCLHHLCNMITTSFSNCWRCCSTSGLKGQSCNLLLDCVHPFSCCFDFLLHPSFCFSQPPCLLLEGPVCFSFMSALPLIHPTIHKPDLCSFCFLQFFHPFA